MRASKVFIFVSFFYSVISVAQEIEKDYYPNGEIKSTIEIRNNKKNGVAILYYENGKVEEKTYFKDDSMINQLEKYYKNGNLESIIILNTMQATYYSEDNSTYEKGKLIKGEKNGIWIEYFNEKKRFEWNYKDGVKNGEYICYRLNGTVEAKGTYINNKLNGKVTYYDEKGKIIKVQYWESNSRDNNSKLIKEETK